MSNAEEQERQRTIAREFLAGKIHAEDALAERDYILRTFKTTWRRITPGSYSVMAFAVGLNYVVIYSEDIGSKLTNEEDKSRKEEVAKGVFFVTGELKTLLEQQC